MNRLKRYEIVLGFALFFNLAHPLVVLADQAADETMTLVPGDGGAPSAVSVNYWHDFAAINDDGTINVVIEITAGMVEKWEVTPDGSDMKQDIQDGKLRVIDYLAYPVNYGMVPRTVLSREFGGDGDPLDVVVIGAPLAQKQVVPVELIGVMNLLDRGEKDDKLIAVVPGSNFAHIRTLDQLEQRYPGILLILQTWFSNYKGPGKMEFKGYTNATEAMGMLRQAHQSYQTGRYRD